MHKILIILQFNYSTWLGCLILCFAFSAQANALAVTQSIKPSGIQAEAQYLPGQTDKSAVLILHGFLTTNQFHTITSIAKFLNDEGHSVLSPTLSLNINNRRNSVKCNTLHTHTLEDDINEIQHWVDWLNAKGYKKITLVGHSSGSLELLEYLKIHNDTRIDKVIFTSIFYTSGKEIGINPSEIELAQEMLVKQHKKLHKFNFLFCHNNYLATPQSFLSYLKLSREYVLNSIKNLQTANYSIMGGADKRYQAVGHDWLTDLEKTGTQLSIIEDANHFFSSEHEFDLQDEIIAIMRQDTTR